MAWTIPWNLVAQKLSGDIGGATIYTDRYGRPTVFPKAPPEKPPSSRQVARRNRFRLAQAEWKAQTDEVKADLEEICRRLSLPLTGQNLWISVALRGDFESYETLQRQSGITVPRPTRV